MYYPTLKDIETIIHEINRTQNTESVITNRGQLEFALEKPKMMIYGSEQYPELYQKAAILMETITKAHALSDGNKRTAMLAAQLMIEANGGYLALPIKSIRLSVGTAMDNEDEISGIIQQWFKVHTATSACHLAAMLAELDEEEKVIKAMLKQNRGGDACSLFDRWVAFDRYPENKQAACELLKRWAGKEKASAAEPAAVRHADDLPPMRDSIMVPKSLPHAQHRYSVEYSGNARELKYNYNSMTELQAAEERILRESARCKDTKDASHVRQAALRLEHHGMYGDAIDMFEKLRTMDTDESDAVSHIAMITQYGLDDPESAIKYWDTYTKYNPDDPVCNLYMGEAFAKLGQYQGARSCLERIKTEMSGSLRANIRMGKIYDKMHEFGTAAKFYEKEISCDPDSPDAYLLLGAAHSNMGNEEKAIECFGIGIRVDPDNPEGYWNMGMVLSDLGENEEAIASYRKALEINPDHLASKINLASTLSNSGRPEEALPYFYSALELSPDHLVALEGLTITLLHVNKTDEALAYADRLVGADASNIPAKYLKAMILADAERPDECLEMLKMLADTDPNFKTLVDLKISQGAFGALLDDKRFEELVGNQNYLYDDS